MKIRAGFVSNSSTTSYHIKVPLDHKDRFRELATVLIMCGCEGTGIAPDGTMLISGADDIISIKDISNILGEEPIIYT